MKTRRRPATNRIPSCGPALAVALIAVVMAACDSGGDDQPPPSGTLGGRVLLTLDGPLVGAQVAVDHLEFTAATIEVRSHVADLVTDEALIAKA